MDDAQWYSLFAERLHSPRHTLSPDGRKQRTKHTTMHGHSLTTMKATMGRTAIDCTPWNRPTLFSENEFPCFGDMPSRPLHRRQSPKYENLFSGNKNPCFGDMQTKQNRRLAPTAKTRGCGGCTRPLPYMVWHLGLQKSSANYLGPRVFAQKYFVDLIFGHFFCPFSQNFFDSCAK